MARKPLKRDKIIEEARERYECAQETWGPIYKLAREDLRFSDPTDPQQWPEEAKRERKNSEGGPRPCMVFDQTQQFCRQVINTARRNKPALNFLPVDDESDPKLADVLKGLARQTEYDSRAEVAYITALDKATRGGLGFFRLTLEEVQGGTVKGQQQAKIKRVVDFESVLVDPDFTEPDGSDMSWGFVEETLTRKRFERMYPKARAVDWDDKGWFTKDHVRICEYYRVRDVNEAAEGEAPQTKRVVEHYKLTGEEVLEQSIFPGEYVPIFPVLGNEEWDEGKRRLSGCIRLARDAQITYNFERNSEFEAVAVGPKAPWTAPAESIEGHEDKWRQANRGNLAYLPFNTVDENGQPIPFRPERVQPAGIAPGWTQLSERSRQDIQAALGMYQASVGNNPNDQSGRAVMALQDKADVGTFHYIDNLALSVSHCGRVLTQVWPVIYDQEQVVRIIGEEDDPKFVTVSPEQGVAYQETKNPLTGKTIISINPGVGRYDVRATVGPAFQTRQVEAAAELGEMVNGNQQLMAILGDVWVKMRNFPEADKIARRLKAMLPPQVQQAEQEEEDGEPQIPPQVMAAIQQLQQQNQQLQQALQDAQSGMAVKQVEVQAKLQQTAMTEESKTRLAQMQIESAERIAAINADVKRDMSELAGAIQLMAKKMEVPLSLSTEVEADLTEPEEPKPDPMAMLAQAIAGMNAPKRKRLAIQAPSGEVYQGMVEDEGPEVLQ